MMYVDTYAKWEVYLQSEDELGTTIKKKELMVKTLLKLIACVSVGIIANNSYSNRVSAFDDKRYYVDFDESMEFLKNDRFATIRLRKKDCEIVKFCRTLYETNNLEAIEIKEEPIIPKIVHLIWVGPLKPPLIFEECLRSIEELLSGWEVKIWTDEDIPGLKLKNQEFYDEESCYGAKADILRYELLYRFGGVYLDVDFVLRQPLDILHHSYEFYTSMMPGNSDDFLANGLIGCVPGHPIIKECVERIKDFRDKEHMLGRTGPFYFHEIFFSVMKKYNYDRVIALPKSFFLPFDYQYLELTDDEKAQQIKPETFAVHYWNNSWGASMPGAWADPKSKKKI